VSEPGHGSLRNVALYSLGLGTTGFGGPVALVFWYFAEAGAFVFGSGLAIVPFLHADVVKEFVDGVTAAATGAIAGAVFALGRRARVDAVTAFAALVVLLRFKRLPEPALILVAGATGILLRS
jgi:chromate transporter